MADESADESRAAIVREVACPTCGCPPGVHCLTSTGACHRSRVQAAVDKVVSMMISAMSRDIVDEIDKEIIESFRKTNFGR